MFLCFFLHMLESRGLELVEKTQVVDVEKLVKLGGGEAKVNISTEVGSGSDIHKKDWEWRKKELHDRRYGVFLLNIVLRNCLNFLDLVLCFLSPCGYLHPRRVGTKCYHSI